MVFDMSVAAKGPSGVSQTNIHQHSTWYNRSYQDDGTGEWLMKAVMIRVERGIAAQ